MVGFDRGRGSEYRKTCVGTDSLPYCKGLAPSGAASLGGETGHWRGTEGGFSFSYFEREESGVCYQTVTGCDGYKGTFFHRGCDVR